MSSVEKKTFATEAAEVMEPNNAKVEIVNVGGNSYENSSTTRVGMV